MIEFLMFVFLGIAIGAIANHWIERHLLRQQAETTAKAVSLSRVFHAAWRDQRRNMRGLEGANRKLRRMLETRRLLLESVIANRAVCKAHSGALSWNWSTRCVQWCACGAVMAAPVREDGTVNREKSSGWVLPIDRGQTHPEQIAKLVRML